MVFFIRSKKSCHLDQLPLDFFPGRLPHPRQDFASFPTFPVPGRGNSRTWDSCLGFRGFRYLPLSVPFQFLFDSFLFWKSKNTVPHTGQRNTSGTSLFDQLKIIIVTNSYRVLLDGVYFRSSARKLFHQLQEGQPQPRSCLAVLLKETLSGDFRLSKQAM